MNTKNIQTSESDAGGIPLCVDLDGSLVRSDILIESLFSLIRNRPLYIFRLIPWLLKGKANFKQKIAERVELNVALLPYDRPFLEFLISQRKTGRRLVLATATNEKFAHQIAEHLGIFDRVFASDAKTNLSAEAKQQCLVDAFGVSGFDYAGNAKDDLPVWQHARYAILVNASAKVRAEAKSLAEVERVFDDRAGGIRAYLDAIRLYQWSKNGLILIPLLAAHQATDVSLLLQAVVAAVAFGFCASSVYLLNDLLDLDTDRLHATKKSRAFAAGRIPIIRGVLLIPLLLATSVAISLFLPSEFLAVLATYYSITLAYSLWLKRIAVLDVVVLAGLYTMRIIAGGAAVSVLPSFWLLAFSMFLFYSLAMVKRYSELLQLQEKSTSHVEGRGYRVADLESLISLGGSSGYLAVLVLALYINSDAVIANYTRPQVIWLLCPLLLYWTSRVWLITRRGLMHDDPVTFAITDRVSLYILGSSAVILLAAL